MSRRFLVSWAICPLRAENNGLSRRPHDYKKWKSEPETEEFAGQCGSQVRERNTTESYIGVEETLNRRNKKAGRGLL